jgi:hypothetical protein
MLTNSLRKEDAIPFNANLVRPQHKAVVVPLHRHAAFDARSNKRSRCDPRLALRRLKARSGSGSAFCPHHAAAGDKSAGATSSSCIEPDASWTSSGVGLIRNHAA